MCKNNKSNYLHFQREGKSRVPSVDHEVLAHVCQDAYLSHFKPVPPGSGVETREAGLSSLVFNLTGSKFHIISDNLALHSKHLMISQRIFLVVNISPFQTHPGNLDRAFKPLLPKGSTNMNPLREAITLIRKYVMLFLVGILCQSNVISFSFWLCRESSYPLLWMM